MSEFGFSPKVQKAFDLWASTSLTEEYYAFVAEHDNWPNTSWEDMDDEEADHVIELLTRYKNGEQS